jgi:type IV secretion system protein VirB11
MSAALNVFLQPFTQILERLDVREICVNQPGNMYVQTHCDWQLVQDKALTFHKLKQLSQLIANYTGQDISENTPLLSASLPAGERIQIMLPPSTEPGFIAFSIRKHQVMNLTLEDYATSGKFNMHNNHLESQLSLKQNLDQGDLVAFFRQAVKAKKNIIISGGTGSGKTTFANTLIKEIPGSDGGVQGERLITLEDAKEIQLTHQNVVRLFASRGGQNNSNYGMKELLQSCLRLNPDRILLSELRGDEALDYLRAVNSGHPGSITTLHADTTAGAKQQIVMMCLRAGSGLSAQQITTYLDRVIDIIVQLDGNQSVSDIDFNVH